MNQITRRRVLRGILNGAVVSVSLPFLECMLDSNGEALASGAPLPVRFGTWTWGLGMTQSIYLPKKVGADYDLPQEIESLRSVSRHLNLYSNFNVTTDGKPNLCHYTGWVAIRTGQVPDQRGALPGASFDIAIADAIGVGSRFRSLEITSTGNPRDSHSFRNVNAVNTPAVSPIALYARVFGRDFQNPNSDTFTPDPVTMVRKSVLSAVREDSKGLIQQVSSTDRARLDQYFTSVRELEQRLEVQLQKPPPAEACSVPASSLNRESAPGIEEEQVKSRHRLMTDILVAALACNQTRVFNMMYSQSGSEISRKGFTRTHHVATHEEPLDGALGYQVESSWFLRRSMDEWAYFVNALSSVREGNGSLLDRSLVFAYSDQNDARTHSVDGIPMWTAGTAGGRMKTGLHIDGAKTPATRVPLTCMQAMGLSTGQFGQNSMHVSNPVTEAFV
jgi:hypothetical protein